MLKRLLTCGLAAAAAALFIGAAPAAPKLTGGNGTLYIGGWPNKVFVLDEATEKITGAIDTATGAPTRMTLSKDRKKFYLVNALADQVEILDVASRKSLDHFTLSDGRKKVRIRSMIPDPLDRFVIMLVKTAETPLKGPLAQLTVAELKKLGVTVEETGDVPFIKVTDGAVDKLVKALLKSASEDEPAEV